MERILRRLAQIPPGPIVAIAALVGLWMMSSAPNAASRVPDLEGMQVNPAIQEAVADGYFTKVVFRPGGGNAGTVVDQHPEPLKVADKRSRIVLYVTRGAAQVKVPDVRGVEVQEARRRLDRGNVVPGTVTYRKDPKVASDRVVTTVPAPNDLVDVGTKVDIIAAI